MTKIPLEQIRTDGGTQPRAKIDQAVVQEYQDDLVAGAAFPAVVVIHDGTDYWLADGFHRVEAMRCAGFVKVLAEVHQGTQRDAVMYSVGVNAAHGMRRTNEDKRRAVETLLRDPEWAKWSDREIAKKCAVGSTLVLEMRRKLSARGEQIPTSRTVERGGTTYTQQTANIGKKARAPKPVVDEMPFDEEKPHVWVRPEPEPEEAPEPDQDAANIEREICYGIIVDSADRVLNKMKDISSRHEVVNDLVKHFRELSVTYNREAAGTGARA